SSGLDPFAWRIMMEEIRTFMDVNAERTVLVATHIMDEVRRLADVIIFLYKGRIVGIYEKDQLMDDWKTIWVSAAIDDLKNIPGVVAIEEARSIGGSAKLVTSDARGTDAELKR